MIIKDPETLDYFHLQPKYRPHFLTAKDLTDAIYTTEALHIRTLAMDFPSGTSMKYRKDLERQWINTLPKLDNVKALWIRHLAGDNFLEAVCEMKNLVCLRFETSAIQSLSAIKKLQGLKKFEFRSQKLRDVAPVLSLKNLEALSFDAGFKIENYEVLGEMKQLKALKLEGDCFAPKNLALQSLLPFQNLEALEHFGLFAVTVKDKSYDVVMRFKNLTRLDITTGISATTAKDLRAGLKNLKTGSVIERNYDGNDQQITKLGEHQYGEVWHISGKSGSKKQ